MLNLFQIKRLVGQGPWIFAAKPCTVHVVSAFQVFIPLVCLVDMVAQSACTQPPLCSPLAIQPNIPTMLADAKIDTTFKLFEESFLLLLYLCQTTQDV